MRCKDATKGGAKDPAKDIVDAWKGGLYFGHYHSNSLV